MRAIDDIAGRLQQAAMQGVHYGQDDLAYSIACKLDVPLGVENGVAKGVRFMFMRHIEDGKRFFALSLSFRDFKLDKPIAFEHAFARQAAPVFYGRRIADVLVTAPPDTPDGRQWQVWYFRLFTDAAWRPLDHKPLITPAEGKAYTWDEYYRMRL